ncbi:MAG: zinc-dependent metalloprotease, partial [bacterium]|nr:zinc-dependent metalloprotease [bacterium]
MVAAADPVDWRLAERVAKRVGGHEPFLDSYHYRSLAPELAEFTAQAEEMVAAETGLKSMCGAARARVTTRAGWVDANVASFQRLLRPVTDKMAERVSASWFAPVAQRVSGTEMGAVLGWMSTRVLGQYDLLIIEDDRPEDQDMVYYVGPNVMALEHKHGFDPRQFRLWLALHETTHRAQFTGIEWLRPYFLGLVQEALDAAESDLEHFKQVAKQVMDARRR